MDKWIVLLYQPQQNGKTLTVPFGSWSSPLDAKEWGEHGLILSPEYGETWEIARVRLVNYE
jgi:hypothetical protein